MAGLLKTNKALANKPRPSSDPNNDFGTGENDNPPIKPLRLNDGVENKPRASGRGYTTGNPNPPSTPQQGGGSGGNRPAGQPDNGITGITGDTGGAKLREVQDEELAQTQLERITSKDSPLMQRAENFANQRSNSRGLLHSSIAIGNAQGEMIDRATPIAQQDAQTFNEQGRANQDVTNEFLLTGKQNKFQAGQNQADRSLRRDLQSEELATRRDLQSEELGFRGEQSALDREFEQNMESGLRQFQAEQNRIEREFQGEENAADRQARENELARQTATELFRQVAGQNASLSDAIAQIQSADIESGGKQRMVDQLIEQHYNSLNTTTAMADFEIVDGEVVYNEAGPAQGQAQGTAPAEQGANIPGTPGYDPSRPSTIPNYRI